MGKTIIGLVSKFQLFRLDKMGRAESHAGSTDKLAKVLGDVLYLLYSKEWI